jgi:hypothetical protein
VQFLSARNLSLTTHNKGQDINQQDIRNAEGTNDRAIRRFSEALVDAGEPALDWRIALLMKMAASSQSAGRECSDWLQINVEEFGERCLQAMVQAHIKGQSSKMPVDLLVLWMEVSHEIDRVADEVTK